jgi:hypothetical protein
VVVEEPASTIEVTVVPGEVVAAITRDGDALAAQPKSIDVIR